jgi:hypothetical protein
MLNFCGIVAAILKMATGRKFQCREVIRDIIIYPHIRKISTGPHFQNGSHNTAQIQHCSISKVAFDFF